MPKFLLQNRSDFIKSKYISFLSQTQLTIRTHVIHKTFVKVPISLFFHSKPTFSIKWKINYASLTAQNKQWTT